MMDVDIEIRFLLIESHLARLGELLAIGAIVNINQRHRNVFERSKSSSSSSQVPFKVEAKVDIPTFGGEVDADKLNH